MNLFILARLNMKLSQEWRGKSLRNDFVYRPFETLLKKLTYSPFKELFHPWQFLLVTHWLNVKVDHRAEGWRRGRQLSLCQHLCTLSQGKYKRSVSTTSAESWTRSLDSKVKASSLQMKGLLREPSEWLDGWTNKGWFASKKRSKELSLSYLTSLPYFGCLRWSKKSKVLKT